MSFKTSMPPHFKIPQLKKFPPKLTVRQITSQTSNKTKLKAKIVAIEKVSNGKVPKALEGYTAYRVQTRNTKNGNQYKLTIFSPEPRITLDSKVIIDSPNPVWVFRYEYAMAQRGNALLYRSNGDAPVMTNPALRPGCDHHVYRALAYLIKNTNRKGLSNNESNRERADANPIGGGRSIIMRNILRRATMG